MLELTTIPENNLGQNALQNRIAAILRKRIAEVYTAIAAISDNPSWFSDPHNMDYIPIPSPSPLGQRFEHDVSFQKFRYMGRSTFATLYNYTLTPYFRMSDQEIYLHGSSGSGKSHILAAFACLLVRKGQRVIYIPNAQDLIYGFFTEMRTAFCFAFYNKTEFDEIASFTQVDELIRFSDHQQMIGNRLYIVVDQVDALEADEDDGRNQLKSRIEEQLYTLAYKHHYIFSASANEKTKNRKGKQDNIQFVPLVRGMNEVR
jgi:energy-coupling factor transporter ATP-binding protein EcfA2